MCRGESFPKEETMCNVWSCWLQNLMLIDEADEAMPGQEKPRRKHTLSQSSMSSMDSPPPSPGMRKRKAGTWVVGMAQQEQEIGS